MPTPYELRGGWAALAAVCAARGWDSEVYATDEQWIYHDGGGNWACLRFLTEGRAVLMGHDHEYSETYYGEAAKYFEEEETDLLSGAPDWWGSNLDPQPLGEWIGFVYGWDGHNWQRANYDVADGFEDVGLLSACSVGTIEVLQDFASDAPGLTGGAPDEGALRKLVDADAQITLALLEAVVPGWNIDAGIEAARKFTG